MTTIQLEKTGKNAGKTSKTKPKVSEIISDIKKGATAGLIMGRHQINPKQLKMIIIHCHKKGIIKKTDLVANFFSKNTHDNLDSFQKVKELPNNINKPKHTINAQDEAVLAAKNTGPSESEENSVDLGNIVQLLIKKVQNEKVLLGKFSLSAQNICAICMVVFFFLPWINIGGFLKFSGYDIPEAIKAIGQFAAAVSKTSEMDPKVYLYYILYLIPIFSVITIILNFKGKKSKNAGLVAAAVPIVSFIYLIFNMGSDIFKALAIGAYLTLFAAAAMIYVTVGDQILSKIRGQKKNKIAGQDLATTQAKGKEVLDVKSV